MPQTRNSKVTPLIPEQSVKKIKQIQSIFENVQKVSFTPEFKNYIISYHKTGSKLIWRFKILNSS